MAHSDTDLAPPQARKSFVQTLELDLRLLGMIGTFRH